MTRVALGNHYYAVSSDMASFAWSSGEVENVDDACLRYQYRDEYHGPVLREIHKGRISMARVKKMLRKGHLKYVPRTMRGIFSKNRWRDILLQHKYRVEDLFAAAARRPVEEAAPTIVVTNVTTVPNEENAG